jgi:Zn-dependent protease with chaperone function
MASNFKMPGDDKPLLEAVNKEHKKALSAIDEEVDRRQEQSRGLGLISNDSFENYANQILNRLKVASGVNNVPGRVYLKAENAWSAKTSASGNIYIPVGMLGDINSEDVFAALLAHELSHAILNHADADLVVRASKKSVIVSSFVNDLSGTADSNSSAYLASLAALTASETFLSPSWSREQESDADFMGLDILIRAGYSPNAMEDLLKLVEVLDERNRLELERRQALVEKANQQVRDDALRNLDYASFVKGSVSDAVSFAGGKFKTLMSTHKSAMVRIDELTEYKKKLYRRVPRKKYQTTAWRSALNTEEIRQVVLGLDKSYLALDQLRKNELREAAETIKSSMAHGAEQQSYLTTVFADIRAAQGDGEAALKNHEIAIGGKYPPFESYKDVSSSRINREKGHDAQVGEYEELLSVFNKYGSLPEYFREMIILANSLGLQDKVVALQIECTAKYAGDGVNCSEVRQSERANSGIKGFLKAL